MHDHIGKENGDIDKKVGNSSSLSLGGMPGSAALGLDGLPDFLEKIGQGADKSDVKRVAPDDMGQLVGNYGLELISGEFG